MPTVEVIRERRQLWLYGALALSAVLLSAGCGTDTSELEAQIESQHDEIASQQAEIDELRSELDSLSAEISAADLAGEIERAEVARAKAATGLVYVGPACDSTGTAVMVSPNHVLTNRHVVEGGDYAFMNLVLSPGDDAPGEAAFKLELVEFHPYYDLALLRIVGGSALGDRCFVDAPRAVEPVVLEVDPEPLRIDDPVQVVGFGYLLTNTVFGDETGSIVFPAPAVGRGTVVGFEPKWSCELGFDVYDDDPNESCSPDGTFLQGHVMVDAYTASGGSGGPIVAKGKLVGLAESIFDKQEGQNETWRLAQGIPSRYFATWLADLIAADTG